MFSKLGDGHNGWKILECWSHCAFCPRLFLSIFCHTSRNCCTEPCPRTAAIASTTIDILNGTLYLCRQSKEALSNMSLFCFICIRCFKVAHESWQATGEWPTKRRVKTPRHPILFYDDAWATVLYKSIIIYTISCSIFWCLWFIKSLRYVLLTCFHMFSPGFQRSTSAVLPGWWGWRSWRDTGGWDRRRWRRRDGSWWIMTGWWFGTFFIFP